MDERIFLMDLTKLIRQSNKDDVSETELLEGYDYLAYLYYTPLCGCVIITSVDVSCGEIKAYPISDLRSQMRMRLVDTCYPIEKKPEKELSFDRYGRIDRYGRVMLYPNETLYEKYRLDSNTAWCKWSQDMNLANDEISTVLKEDENKIDANENWRRISVESRQRILKYYEEYSLKTSKNQYDLGVLHACERIFSYMNLSHSKIRTDETLSCSRDKVISLNAMYLDAMKADDADDRKWGELLSAQLKRLFGDKCLPDMPEPTRVCECGGKMSDCRWRTESGKCLIKSGCYYESGIASDETN